MTSGSGATPGMTMSAAAIEQVIIEALLAASSDRSVPVSRDTDVLQVVDSLGLMMSLADIQTKLNIRLEPQELIDALQARSIADVAVALTTALAARRA
jgi:acyl carrier protein